MGKSAARFDITRLENLNSHYVRGMDEGELCRLLADQLHQTLKRDLSAIELARLPLAIGALKERAKTLVELADKAQFLVASRPLIMEEKAASQLTGEAPALLALGHACLQSVEDWNLDNVTAAIRGLAEAENLKLGNLAQPLRAALTGRNASPGIFEVLYFLGRQESLDRIGDYLE